jgi:hypothetical protein
VYTTLQRSGAKGMVATWLSEPRAERGGKARRLIKVEPKGVTAVREATVAIRAMMGGLESIVGVRR